MRKLLSVILVLAFILVPVRPNVSHAEESEEITDDELEIVNETLNEFNSYFEEYEVTVEDQLDLFIASVHSVVSSEYECDFESVLQLVKDIEEIRNEYIEDRDGEEEELASMSLGFGFFRNRTCRMVVAAAIAFFSSQGCLLAAELLTHARVNWDSDSTYYPVFGYRARNTSTCEDVINFAFFDYAVTYYTGTAKFEKSSDLYEKDLYYAVHETRFICDKDEGWVKFEDYYDYDVYDWDSIEGVAKNVMRIAQRLQILIPYGVVIRVDI